MRVFKSAIVAGTAALCLALPLAGQAGATTLTYTGSNFTNIQDPDFGTSLNAVVVTDNPLPTNFTGTLTASDIQSFTLTGVGGTAATVQGLVYPTAPTITFTDGIITSWDVEAFSSNFGSTLYETYDLGPDPGNFALDSVESFGRPGAPPPTVSASNYNQNSPGTWTIAAGVPEPASWAMMILGVGAIGFALRDSRRSATSLAI